MGQASTRSLTWPQEEQNRKRAKEDLIVMQQQPQGTMLKALWEGRRLQALLLERFLLILLCRERERERESVRTRRDENGKNAVPKLRRAGRVGLLELTIIAKLAIIHNKI